MCICGFRMWTHVGPRNYALDEGLDPQRWEGTLLSFERGILGCAL